MFSNISDQEGSSHERPRYEAPVVLPLGQTATAQGACNPGSIGFFASFGFGSNPDPGGCSATGNSASLGCYTTGNSARGYLCGAGGGYRP